MAQRGSCSLSSTDSRRDCLIASYVSLYFLASGHRSVMTYSTMLHAFISLEVLMLKTSCGDIQVQYTRVRPAKKTECKGMSEKPTGMLW